ncbi:MAG: DUF4476 domain-containing protein [Chitinophagaceae bacterium]
MKKLSFLLLGVILYTSLLSQTVTIRFEGTASSNTANARNYAVDVDGRSYYSSNADNASGMKQVVLSDLTTGSHKFAVYDMTNYSAMNESSLLYSNTFQLRTGYDMVIAVRRNGNVTFTEKKSTQVTGSTSGYTPMTDAEFTKLTQSVKAKWSQSSRATSIQTAFANKAYYFTTDQAGQLLMMVTSEAKRLELAKLAYPKITDQQNFADVADLFNSQANKDNISAFYQTQNPGGVVSTNNKVLTTQQFNQLLRKVRNQYDQSGKYAVVQDALNVSTNYFTTAQLRQLLTLITPESSRLALAKLSYARVSDETNFASLNDLFTAQASRDELNNYVRYGGSIGSTGQYASRIAMSESDFSKLHTKARFHLRQSSTIAAVKDALSNKTNYFTLDQTRSLLSLISSETDRLTLAKLAYHRAADPTSFTQLYDLFTTQASIDEMNNYIRITPL